MHFQNELNGFRNKTQGAVLCVRNRHTEPPPCAVRVFPEAVLCLIIVALLAKSRG